MVNSEVQNEREKVQDDVFNNLPRWCKVILKLKEEIKKEKKPKAI